MSVEQKKNLSQQLADQIQDYIEAADLPDGEFFMTEADVAEKFEASRTVAREAVARLRAIGILEGRQRKGLIVRRPDPIELFSLSLPSFAKSQSDIAELAQLRYVIEVGAIELAVRNATDEQIERLLGLAGEIQKGSVQDIVTEHTREIDIAFHSLLLEMTGSELIAGLQRVLVDFFAKLKPIASPKEQDAQRIAWEHVELAASLRDRDLERARTLIRMQLLHYLDEDDPVGKLQRQSQNASPEAQES